jgi:PAS domain S-box-containing protein
MDFDVGVRTISQALCLLGATVLNVIEGGKKSQAADTGRRVDLGALLEALPEAAVLLDQRGRIADLNQSCEKFSGRPRQELIGLESGSVFGQGLESREDIQALLAHTMSEHTSRAVNAVFHCTNGDTIRLTLCANPIHDSAGKVNAVLLTIHDVSELAALQKQSESNERHVAVGQMTAGLIHDFNNVLSTISEAVTVLQMDEQRSARDATVLGIIGNAVHYGAETIRNTREYLVGTREKPTVLDVRQLLEEVLELTHPALKASTGIVVLRETQDCGKVMAIADELRRAFTNLVLNALEAMPQGGTLTVGCCVGNGRVTVQVRDTGIGIPFEVQRKIFSPYFTTKSKGTGIGLAGARRAIQAQGGEIRFESTPAAGTVFFVTLPTVETPAQEAPSAA